jgi:hypothetical protein
MHVFPATFDRHGTRQGNHVVAFEVDETNRELIRDVAIMNKNTPVIVVVYEVKEGEDPLSEVYNDDQAMRTKLMSQVHAIMKEYAGTTGVELKEIKKILKHLLKARNIDVKSLKECTENDLATAVFILNTIMDPSKFNYQDYK